MWRVDDCFTHGCVFCYWMCRPDVSVIRFRMCIFFIIVFGLVVMNFFIFPCLWEISFSTQIGSSSDHMIILAGLEGVG